MEEKLEEIIRLLQTFHYSKAEAAVLTYLMIKDEGSAHDIERITDLRQPEISIAITRLRRSKRIKIMYQAYRKGRPTNIYQLTGSSDDLLSHARKWQEARYLSRMNLIANTKRIFRETRR